MQRNELLRKGDSIIRVVSVEEERVLVIDCLRPLMPKWVAPSNLSEYDVCSEDELYQTSGFFPPEIEILSTTARRIAYERYTTIAGILPYVADETKRSDAIRFAAKQVHKTEI